MADPRLERRVRRASWPLAVALAGCTAGLGCSGSAGERVRPNVVLIVVDTLRADAILDPAQLVATPNIDALAKDGVAYAHAFSHAPMTLPSHTSLFASRPPVETGVLNNGQSVPDDLPLLAEWLQDFGYQTHAVLSLGTLSPIAQMGLDRGFETYDMSFWQLSTAEQVLGRVEKVLADFERDEPFFLFAHFSDPHEPYDSHGGEEREATMFLDGAPLTTFRTSEYEPYDGRLDLAKGRHVLEIRSEKKFVVPALQIFDAKTARVPFTWEVGGERKPGRELQLAFEAPKDGEYRLRFRANDTLSKPEARQRYIREVEYVDRYVGRLVEALRAAGLYDDSVIVFTSDHGEALGEHGHVGHVENLFDEMLRVPLIVKPPVGSAALPALQASRGELVTLCDVVPTILNLCALPPLTDQRGRSLLAGERSLLVSQTHKPEAKRNLIAIRDARYKLVYDVDADSFELYDVTADPGEKRNVFKQAGAERAEWQGMLREFGRISAEGGRRETSDETAEMLRALGYVDLVDVKDDDVKAGDAKDG